MLLHTCMHTPPLRVRNNRLSLCHSFSSLPFGSLKLEPYKRSFQVFFQSNNLPDQITSRESHMLSMSFCSLQADTGKAIAQKTTFFKNCEMHLNNLLNIEDVLLSERPKIWVSAFSSGLVSFMISSQVAHAEGSIKSDVVYEVGELFELGIQLSYLLLLLALLGAGTFFVIRQVLVRRELDLSAKELQEQVRSGDASATEFFELGAVMLRRKFYPAAIKYLLQAIENGMGMIKILRRFTMLWASVMY
ncbi:hypothetical protein K2173_011519 [Erythroxylum novogranatense]|uniref:Uncharacterized protein n=1 Tax=Erythroxylum novogranatense TaxID=1862640 RepID=A0AAV8TVU4_9ROSI|nr:hypothetical protein K2173_011519 [Erythroxylum novogranatense]